MKTLILIKHARPRVDPAIPSHEWTLSDEGRQSCAALAERLRPHAPGVIVTSDEAKAEETGRLVAEALGVPHHTAPGLHEHDRSNVPHMRTPEFVSAVAQFFKRQTDLTLGRETAEQAGERFEKALRASLADYDSRDAVAVVSHGTVLALFAARHSDADPFALWRAMGLPSFLVFDVTDPYRFELRERIEKL